MHIKMYEYVIENRGKILEKLNKQDYIEKAKKQWKKFSDESNNGIFGKDEVNNTSSDNGTLIGIDSSWNLIPYNGYYLYAVEAVAITNDDFVEPKREIAIDTLEDNGTRYNPRLILESKGMKMEYELAKESIKKKDKTDIILVDGSLQARMYDNKNVSFHEFASDILNRDDIIFIAKRTESRSMLNGTLGDIYYFSKATYSAGYSNPSYTKNTTALYARFTDGAPCVKIEFGTRLNEDIILDRLLRIQEMCISGYPYVLKMAHERCKISDEDMKNIEHILNLQFEIGGREVMES